jgi:hypothetical protein
MSVYRAALNAPTAYVREDDEAEMIELKPHCYVSRRALAVICSPKVVPPPRASAAPRRTSRNVLWD